MKINKKGMKYFLIPLLSLMVFFGSCRSDRQEQSAEAKVENKSDKAEKRAEDIEDASEEAADEVEDIFD